MLSGRIALSVLLGILIKTLVLGQELPVRGTYSHPKPLWDKGARLDEYGINAIFVHSGSLTAEMLARARAEGAKVYAEFATLNGKNYVDKHPEAWPIDETGAKSPPATWFQGACPTEPGFRAFRIKQLEELLEKHPIDGVWMDYLHWHAQFEDPRPVLPETCFSDTCLAAFQKNTGIRVPAGSTAGKARWILSNHEERWRDWRCSVITGWAEEFRRVIRSKRPGVLLGNYQCPWTDDEFGGARRRILGLDLDRLAAVVDVISPMVYHKRMGRTPEWVGEYVSWLSGKLKVGTPGAPKLWPIVQAHGDPAPIPAAEFEKVLRLGASGKASGVMMFTVRSVAEDEEKMRVLKRVYGAWAGK